MQQQQILNFFKFNNQEPGTYTGSEPVQGSNIYFNSVNPFDNSILSSCEVTSESSYETVIKNAQSASDFWKKIPAPQRGELVRQIGEELRKEKEQLGALVSLEMGKIYQEGLGEVQEMIDICEFAVGLSRQLYGLSMHSERPEHRMLEQWHPLGVVGIISAFNFPVAVWAWNSMIAIVCGNVSIWKASEKTPLTAIACQKIASRIAEKNGYPKGLFSLISGDKKIGDKMVKDTRIPLISATGSTAMGRVVGQNIAARFGKSILELGGNNAVIITENANLDLAIPAVIFGAVGTCGQRCTSTRRIIVHKKIATEVQQRIVEAYQKLPIGNPLNPTTLVGPLIDKEAVDNYRKTLKEVVLEGGTIITGGEVLENNFVKPTLVKAKNEFASVQKETFAPILYLLEYDGDVSEGITIQNNVKQGLSSAIFSENIKETEKFLSAWGSDCGIANVNIGTSGAEIGGAFGGEKETGGGRESGSDAWKSYMRRQTNTINFSDDLPLAQGIDFNI